MIVMMSRRFAIFASRAITGAVIGFAAPPATAQEAFSPDPALCESDAALPLPSAQIAAGRTAYRALCADCHGADAAGASAPDVTGILADDVRKSSFGVENMPAIALADDQAEIIAIYLMSLTPDQAKKRFCLRRARAQSR